MRIVDLHDRLIGAYLAMPIHGDGGKLMLGAGTRLTRSLIKTLRARGYTKVVVKKSLMPDSVPDHPISLPDTSQTETALEEAANRLLAGRSPDLKRVLEAVDAIIANLWANSGMSSGIVSIQSYDGNTYTHSINVCILSISIGHCLGWRLEDLRELGTAALLHDIGKILIPLDLLNKAGPLTAEEHGLMRTHCEKGWKLLSECFNTGVYCSRSLEHHGRLDGSGYPKGLTENMISDIGKITAVADVYDAMTRHRPHRKAIFPETLQPHGTTQGVLFDSAAVDALLSKVALYPTGTLLSLWEAHSSGDAQIPAPTSVRWCGLCGNPGASKQ